FLPLVFDQWRLLLEVLGYSLLLQLFGLATPLFMQAILDRVLVHRDVAMLNLMLAGMIIVVVFQLLTSAMRQFLLVYVVRRLVVLVTIPGFALLSLSLTPALRANLLSTFEAHSAVQSHLVETVSGVQAVKSVRAEQPVRWKWEELLLKYIRLQFSSMNFRLAL